MFGASVLLPLLGPVHRNAVIFFTLLGTVPIPDQLGKISMFSLQLGKIVPLDLYEQMKTQAGNVKHQHQEQ